MRAGRYEVIATDLPNTPKARIGQLESLGAKFLHLDVTRPETIGRAMNGVDRVFHVAAIFDYSAPWDLLAKVNVNGTENLIRGSLDAGVDRVTVWSSLAAYGLPLSHIYEHPITEDQHPVRSGDPEGSEIEMACNYDRSKRMQEEVVHRYVQEEGLRATIVRPASTYGPGNKYGVWQIIYLIGKGLVTVLPTSIRKRYVPLIHVRDNVRAAIHLADTDESIGQTYNLCDNSLDMFETVKFINIATGHRVTATRVLPSWVLDHSYWILKLLSRHSARMAKKKNYRRAKLELDTINYLLGLYWYSNAKLLSTGFRYDHGDRRSGLAETISWYYANGWLDKKNWFD